MPDTRLPPSDGAEGFFSMNANRVFVRTEETVAMEQCGIMVLLYVRCAAPVAHFPAHHLFTRVEYRTASREVWVQDAPGGAMQRLRVVLRAEDIGMTPRALENEVLAFMQRGHSCIAPACRCPTGLSLARALDLGIEPARRVRGACALRRVARFTSAELERELGLTSLDAVLLGTRSVRSILAGGSFFALADRMWALARACTVQDRAALLIYVNMSPLGVDMDAASIQYPHLARDTAALQREGRLLVHAGLGAGTRRLFRVTCSTGPCDRDLAALWHRAR